jgi:hypothetical protein
MASLSFPSFPQFFLMPLRELSRTLRLSPLALVQKRTPSAYHPLLQSPPEGKSTLANLFGIVKQLKKERDRVQHQLSGLNAALAAFAGVYAANTVTNTRRKMSAKGRARIAAAQRARWAKDKVQGYSNRTSSEETNNVGIGSSQDRSGSTSEMGEGQAGESGLKRSASLNL